MAESDSYLKRLSNSYNNSGKYYRQPKNVEITQMLIEELLGRFMSVPYNVLDPHNVRLMEECLIIFKKDYIIDTIDNTDGRLCAHYPPKLILIKGEKSELTDTSPIQKTETNDTEESKHEQIPIIDITNPNENSFKNSKSDYSNLFLSSSEILRPAFDYHDNCPDIEESVTQPHIPEEEIYPSKIVMINPKSSVSDEIKTNTNFKGSLLAEEYIENYYDIIDKDEVFVPNLPEKGHVNSVGGETIDSKIISNTNLSNGVDKSLINSHRLSDTNNEILIDSNKQCNNNTQIQDPALESSVNKAQIIDSSILQQLFLTARFARVRSRFTVPVLLYKNNNLCRGSTLSVGAEQVGRSGWDRLWSGGEGVQEQGGHNLPIQDIDSYQGQLCDKIRGQDVLLLKTLGVTTIINLMYQEKKYKFLLVPIASSERADKFDRYREFNVVGLPYPGCEMFKGYKIKARSPESIFFNWLSTKVTVNLDIPNTIDVTHLGISWQNYKNWSLKELTANYLRLMLHQLEFGSGGLLVHCISGWDRTPLMIGLIRASLWADSLIHKSVTPIEMLYLLIAYDWRLFGHKLTERQEKDENVFYFAFDCLRYISTSEFSIHYGLKKCKDPEFDETNTERYKKLKKVRNLFYKAYNIVVTPRLVIFSNLLKDSEKKQIISF